MSIAIVPITSNLSHFSLSEKNDINGWIYVRSIRYSERTFFTSI